MTTTRIITRWTALAIALTLAFFTGMVANEPHTKGSGSTLTAHRITEEDPGWNCLTMGNRICGPRWTLMPATMQMSPEFVHHGQCLQLIGDTTTYNCIDGFVSTS